ncbi:MAG TPA: hypothetical protein VJJ28_00735 [Candidatus Paceibacterota bacterium]
MTTNKIGGIIGTIIIVLTIIGCIVWNKVGSHKTSSPSPELTFPFTRVLILEHGKWSPSVVLGITRPQLKMNWGVIEDNARHLVEINGGKAMGGFTYEVPSRKDWEKLGWNPPSFPNTTVEVRFKLTSTETQKARLAYTISQVEK